LQGVMAMGQRGNSTGNCSVAGSNGNGTRGMGQRRSHCDQSIVWVWGPVVRQHDRVLFRFFNRKS
jgi:hypothetical protein